MNKILDIEELLLQTSKKVFYHKKINLRQDMTFGNQN